MITIFDAHPWNKEDNSKWEQDYSAISQAIENDRLKRKNDRYNLERFEAILKRIGMNVLLIAHQHQSLTSENVKKRSLSCASSKAMEYVKYGYIDALEYTKSRVQGILLSDFTTLNATAATIVGSDCHTWSAYLLHDKSQTPRQLLFDDSRPAHVQGSCDGAFIVRHAFFNNMREKARVHSLNGWKSMARGLIYAQD